jgi:hypothetical protein
MTKTRIKSQVRLTGSVDPEHITKQLKMEADETWKLGDKMAHTCRRHKDNGWELTSGWEDSSDLGEQAKKILDRVNYRIGILKQWAANNRQTLDMELSCCVELCDQAPSINFGPVLLERAASLGMTIDVDIIQVAN